MTTVHVLFGTESGNSEMVAEELATALDEAGIKTRVAEMSEVGAGELASVPLAIFVTSTYGEGELPESAAPFHADLETSRPDLSHLRFGAFGLGDSTYETYNNGVAVLRDTLVALGAVQVGGTGLHDAASATDPAGAAAAWAAELAPHL